MKVSELAKRAGIAPSAVRFYEANGILPAARRGVNRYRTYDGADLCRLRMVVALRKLGVDLQESGRLASLCSAGQCDEMATELTRCIDERRTAIAAARAELEHLDSELANLQMAFEAGQSPASLCNEGSSDDECSLGCRPAARPGAATEIAVLPVRLRT